MFASLLLVLSAAAGLEWAREGMAAFDASLREAKAGRKLLLVGLSGGDF